jgi:hypothetical protein
VDAQHVVSSFDEKHIGIDGDAVDFRCDVVDGRVEGRSALGRGDEVGPPGGLRGSGKGPMPSAPREYCP